MLGIWDFFAKCDQIMIMNYFEYPIPASLQHERGWPFYKTRFFHGFVEPMVVNIVRGTFCRVVNRPWKTRFLDPAERPFFRQLGRIEEKLGVFNVRWGHAEKPYVLKIFTAIYLRFWALGEIYFIIKWKVWVLWICEVGFFGGNLPSHFFRNNNPAPHLTGVLDGERLMKQWKIYQDIFSKEKNLKRDVLVGCQKTVPVQQKPWRMDRWFSNG